MTDEEIDRLAAIHMPGELQRSTLFSKGYGMPMFVLHARHTVDGKRVYSTMGGQAVSSPISRDAVVEMLERYVTSAPSPD